MTPERNEYTWILNAITSALPKAGLPERENAAGLIQKQLRQDRSAGKAHIDGAELRADLAKQVLARRCGNSVCDNCACRLEAAELIRGGPALDPAEGTPSVPAELIEVGRQALRLYIDQRAGLTLFAEAMARVVLEAVTAHAWVVPRIPHDQHAPCGPRLLPDGLIRVEQEDADAERIRAYAAQLLAAAEVEVEDGGEQAGIDTGDRQESVA